MTDLTDRADLIAGLRSLAEWLETNPAIPASTAGVNLQHSILHVDDEGGLAEATRIAGLAGVPLKAVEDSEYSATVPFGRYVAYYAVHICRKRYSRSIAHHSYHGAVTP